MYGSGAFDAPLQNPPIPQPQRDPQKSEKEPQRSEKEQKTVTKNT